VNDRLPTARSTLRTNYGCLLVLMHRVHHQARADLRRSSTEAAAKSG